MRSAKQRRPAKRVRKTVASAAGSKRRRRRKEARPGEIIQAAIEVFSEQGFGAAKLAEVARRAGVAKGTVFVYFPTKQDLFRAVAHAVLDANLQRLQSTAPAIDTPLADLVPRLLLQAADVGESRIAAILRLLLAEYRTFPDLPRVWHSEVVSRLLGLISAAISRAQARGEIRSGDPELMAFSIAGPMLAGVIFREVFGATDASLPDLRQLAAQHATAILRGLLTS